MSIPYAPITYELHKTWSQLWQQCTQSSSDYSFTVLWGWASFFGYEAALDKDLLWLRQNSPEECHLAPVGYWDRTDWESCLLEQVGRKARFTDVPEHLAQIWQEQLGVKVAVAPNRNAFEYLYDIKGMVDLSGSRHMRQRNKIHQFQRHFAWSYRSLDDSLIEPILELQSKWLEERVTQPGDTLTAEDQCIRTVLPRWKEQGLIGGALEVDGTLVAYTIAEPAADGSLQIHFEKGLEAFPGSYQAISHEFLARDGQQWTVANREEDMGDPGLRHAKMAASPLGFLRKFIVQWDADAKKEQKSPILPPSPFEEPAPEEPQEEKIDVAAIVEKSTEPTLTREEAIARLRCKGLIQSFETRKACTRWQALEADLDEYIDAQAQEAIRISDDLARHPEISGEEYRSSALFASLLKSHGFAVEQPFLELPTAFMARRKLGHGGPVIALLVEYDALPVVGHGCGHNLHGTMSVFAGLALAHALDRARANATLWVVGTPAEEADGAKIAMAQAGVFDKVDLALMFHSNSQDTYVDARFLALDGYRFTFRGRTAHASAAPWLGRSAQNGVRLFMDAIDMFRLQSMPQDRIHALVESIPGGAVNVVPGEASCIVETRAPQRERLDEINEIIFDCARGAALATGTTVEWSKFISSFDDMVPNETAEELSRFVFQQLGITVLPQGPGPQGSSDIGNVSHRSPAVHPMLSISSAPITGHSVEFANATQSEEGHQALITGIRALTRIVGYVVADEELRRLIRKDFQKQKH